MRKVVAGILVVLMVVTMCACGKSEFVGDWYFIGQDELLLEIESNGTAIYHDLEGYNTYKGNWEEKDEELYVEMEIDGSTRIFHGTWDTADQDYIDRMAEYGVHYPSKYLFVDTGYHAYDCTKK